MTDHVNHPPHYKGVTGLEAINVIEGFDLNFRLGNCVKYILRAGRKGARIEDLQKAQWYLSREIVAAAAQHSPLSTDRLYYLATPYSKYAGGIDKAFEDAAALAAGLMASGLKVYSPIAHTHPLAIHGQLDPLDHSIWLPFDEVMMQRCDCLLVAHMDGWQDSFGIAHEIDWFAKANKPVFDLDPVTMQIVERV